VMEHDGAPSAEAGSAGADWQQFRYDGPELSVSCPRGWQVTPGLGGATLAVMPTTSEGMSFVPNVTLVFASGADDPLGYLHGNLGEMRAQMTKFATVEVKQDPESSNCFTVSGTYEREGQDLCLWQSYRVGAKASMILTATCAADDREEFESLLGDIMRSVSLSPRTEGALGARDAAT
jgi:hypothetical protein